MIVLEAYLAFSVGPELDMRAKPREAICKTVQLYYATVL